MLFSGLSAPSQQRAAARPGAVTAAETVLSQSGAVGQWLFPEPPGTSPIKCFYPADTQSQRSITYQSPVVYPAPGLSSQFISAIVHIMKRMPDGSFVEAGAQGGSTGIATPASPLPQSAITSFFTDLGSTYVLIVHIDWSDAQGGGHVQLLYTQYQTTFSGSPEHVNPITDACSPFLPPTASIDPSQGIVGTHVSFSLTRFPTDPTVGIYFDGTKIGSVASDAHGNADGSFIVPAAPMGPHTVRFYRFGRNATAQFTIKPRIKITPSTNLHHGNTVNVSLRGYATHEMVKIRWKQGSSFTEIAHVTTSSTGSANINVQVPNFAAIGTNSVRGDGSVGHAQTNAVTVIASSSKSSAAKPSPTLTKTSTPKPIATEDPAIPTSLPQTSTPEPSATASTPAETPTSEPATESLNVIPTTEPPATIENETTENPTATALPTETPTEVAS
jgi:hypothetical protein